MGTDDPHVLAPGHAPTPFTADEIRVGCPAGRAIRLRVEAVGEEPFVRVSRFTEVDDEGAVFERAMQALDGSTIGEAQSGRVTWLQLQRHASFPEGDTTIETVRIETALGDLDCLRYTVRDGEDENVFWFAKALPGMPIRQLTRVGGEIVSTADVVDNTTP